jgi:hypothetical protein
VLAINQHFTGEGGNDCLESLGVKDLLGDNRLAFFVEDRLTAFHDQVFKRAEGGQMAPCLGLIGNY